MKEVKEAVNGYAKPLEKLAEIIKSKDGDDKALDVVALCKQVEELTDVIKKTLIAKANAEYQELIKTQPTVKQWQLLSGEALVSKYGAKATWIYSVELLKEETALKAKMKEEQTSGKAKKVMPKEDPLRVAMYAITLKQLPINPVKSEAAKSLDTLEPASV